MSTGPRRHCTASARQHSSGDPRAVAARGILDSYRQQQTAERSATLSQDGDDDAPCSAECVTAIYSAAEFDEQLARVPDHVLVVVDFYRCAADALRHRDPLLRPPR